MFADMPRTAWEQPGYTVAEHTDAPPVDRRKVTHVVIHYPGTDNVSDDTRSMLQSTQRYYVDSPSRGYSIGYNWIIGTDGTCWEARGTDFRSAATKGFNVESVAVQIKQAGQTPATPAQIGRVRRLVADLQRWTGTTLVVSGHRDHTPTQCPGEGMYPQVLAGEFIPRTIETSEDLEMQIVSPPVRVYDSRQEDNPLAPKIARRINVGYDTSAVFVNLTVTQQDAPGYLTAWGEGKMPDVSNLNFAMKDLCNTSWVPVVDGHITLWSYSSTHVIVDVQAVAD